jgi:carboxylesterase type B
MADPTDFIKTSLRLAKPVIMVHFSHRLNVLGYGVYGSKTNFGFHDQKRAIEWVQKHVAGFGGDPVSSVTFPFQH